jgi:fructose/tagatose bisphosphate aldolase
MAAEAELGAVWGHEAGPMPPYEQLYNTGKGFTDPDQAGKFVQQTDVDWLSVAIGNIHGAVSPAKKDLQKIQAKLNIDRLTKIKNKTKIPLVLHGGSGIQKPYIINAIKNGIAKINVGTTIRQAYERNKDHSISDAQNHVYQTIHRTIETEFEITHLLQP